MSRDKYRAWDENSEIMYYSDQEYEDCYFGFDKGCVVAWLRQTEPGTREEPPYDYGEPVDCEQYIGLNDSIRTKKVPQGREIYDGDIVEAVGQEVVKVTKAYRKMEAGIYNFVVFWSEPFAGWGFKHQRGSIHPNVGLREYKVIGNIHQHPHLLITQPPG